MVRADSTHVMFLQRPHRPNAQLSRPKSPMSPRPSRLLFPLLCALLLLQSTPAQIRAQAVAADPAAKSRALLARLPSPPAAQPLPGTRPGTERWLVTLRRGASRQRLAKALRGPSRSPETVQAVRSAIAELQAELRVERADFVRRLEALGGSVVESFWLVDVLCVELPPSALETLSDDRDVARVDPNTLVGLAAAPIDEAASLANHAVRKVHQLGIRGQGLVIAILDTGLDSEMGKTGRPHAVYYAKGDPTQRTGPGLDGSRLLANIQVGKQSADDVSGHGTAVGAVAIGARWNQLRGVGDGHAPEALIVGYALADTRSGETQAATMVRAAEALVRDQSSFGFRVANFSYLGHPDPLHPAQQALDRAQRLADILVTTPAGNQNASTVFSMSNANGLAVGAVQSNSRRVTIFSSRGPLHGDSQRFFPDLCANGSGLVMPAVDDEATTFSTIGTSTAAPQVAGSLLLFRGLLPGLTALQCKAAVLASTDDVSMHNRPSALRQPQRLRARLPSQRPTRRARTKQARFVATREPDEPAERATLPVPVRRGSALRHHGRLASHGRDPGRLERPRTGSV